MGRPDGAGLERPAGDKGCFKSKQSQEKQRRQEVSVKQTLTEDTHCLFEPKWLLYQVIVEAHSQTLGQSVSQIKRPVKQQQPVSESQLPEEHSGGFGGDVRGSEEQQGL